MTPVVWAILICCAIIGTIPAVGWVVLFGRPWNGFGPMVKDKKTGQWISRA